MLTNQRYKLAGAVFFDLMCRFRLDHSHQFLRFAGFANRNHQTAADFQLRDQWIRNPWPTGRDQDSVIGPVRIPSQRAIESLDRGIIDSQFAESAP